MGPHCGQRNLLVPSFLIFLREALMFKRVFCFLLALICTALLPLSVLSEQVSAREAFIDAIIASARQVYEDTNGRARRASNAGDIYICKNFTTYVFRQNRDSYRMAEFPDVPLVIPDNLSKEECKPFANGIAWKNIPAEKGNPFIVAASFRYDTALSKEENRALATEFLHQVQKGDFFQMTAVYYYGTGPHSLIFIEDYDAENDCLHWTDSNMKGERRNGIRYAYVQFDAVKETEWFVDAFCLKNHGATLYRLREDIIFH